MRFDRKIFQLLLTATLLMSPSMVRAQSGTSSAAVSQFSLKNVLSCPDTSVSANTIICTSTQPIGAYSTSQFFLVTVKNANTGATTININGLGAIAVNKNGSQALASGDIAANGTYWMYYTGSVFDIVGITGGTSSGGTPGGLTTQMQYNNAGAFGGVTNLTSNGTNPLLTAIVAPASPSAGFDVLYEDSTDLRFHDKNASGTIGTTVVSSTLATHNFATNVSAAGVLGGAQPAFSDISGACTPTQGCTGLSNPAAHSLLQSEGTSNFALLTAAGYAGVPQSPSCVTGSDCTIAPEGVTARTDSTATPAIVGTDRGNLVILTNASPAATIPAAGTAPFDAGFFVLICNEGSGVATLTPTTSTINGAASQKLALYVAANHLPPSCMAVVADGSNYDAYVIPQADANGLIPSVGLENTAVTPGSYTNTNITVNAEGQITSAANGAGGGVTINAVNLTAQTADTGITTIITPGANGFYRMEGVVTVTTVGTSGCATPKVQARFTDADSNQTQGDTLTDISGGDNVISTCTTLGARNIGDLVFYAKSGVAIQYSVSGGTYTGGLVYAARIRLWGPY